MAKQTELTPDKKQYLDTIKTLDTKLRVSASFDLGMRDFVFGTKDARIYFTQGLVKDEIMERILNTLILINPSELNKCTDTKSFINAYIPYTEVESSSDVEKIVTQVLAGQVALVVEGIPETILVGVRTAPTRSLQEPDSDRVMHGARDSFCETLLLNTALIRRHIRDPHLTMQNHTIGSISKTDVILCYLDGRADQKTIDNLAKKLDSLKVKTLAMAQESLTEALLPRRWYNPFPKVRYTERPDTAAATVTEGGILLIVDGSPSVILLPTAFFDFFQDTNDYYFPPLVGTYLRIVRYIIHTLTMLLIPTWFLFIKNPDWIPNSIDFISVLEMNKVPIFFQLMVVELIIDCLKQASLNTPAALGSSFSVVSALILGDFAVKARWFVPEVLLYMAFVAVANFASPSFELGYAVKLCRMMLLVVTALFNLWGYIGGIVLILVLVATTPTITGQSYLTPLIPFDGQKLLRLLVRRKMHRDNT
ncbi:spore germination protein [Oscillospiraceae bacterium LTW-04]|nr:spore germination protein [Oscillospiraceae bacterium MB24-C1]